MAKVDPGTPPQDDPKAQKAAAEEQKVHEEGAAKRANALEFDNYEDAYADYQEKQQRLAEAVQEAQAAEQNLPELRIKLQQKAVDEVKAQPTQYTDDGRVVGADGENPVSLPRMYSANPDPKTLGVVH